ncbi:hypothetical protein INT47_007769 [Mucor saturninus]|uniref:F-box domain-containing protein n=1 Tax=Mucor saturninus TaxID=64648 RepID=A0A8H7V3C9_9FUNG|nr:hypothetical protein INT47_007769 [Mucor saturninus]
MSILDLSQEIIRELFHYSSNLLQCSLVCKRWNATALQLLYREVTLHPCHLYHTMQQLKLDPNERDGYFKYGPFVKKLKFSDNFSGSTQRLPYNLIDVDMTMNEEDFISLLECLPNLEELDLGHSLQIPQYQVYILYTKSKKCLNHLQVLKPSPRSVEHTFSALKRYFEIAYKYRATITETVLYHQYLFSCGDNDESSLATLSRLSNLTRLTLVNTSDEDLTTLGILKSCPNLTKLVYESTMPIPDAAVNKLLNNFDCSNLGRNLKTFCITIPTLPLNYVRYLTNYLSPKVEYVAICLEEYLHEWIHNIGMKDALKLLSRLGSGKRATFSLNTFGDSAKREARYNSKITNFFRLIDAFKGNREMYSHLVFRSVDENSYDPTPEFLIDNTKGELNLNYTLEMNEYFLSDEMNVDHRTFKAILPDVCISNIGLEIINDMRLDIDRSSPRIPYNFLQYAIKYCPNLSHFKFSYLEQPFESFSVCTVAHPDKKKKSKCLLQESPTEGMKVIRIVDRVPDETCLGYFSALFKNIEVLLLDSKYGVLEPPFTAEIDITDFKNLNTFGFSLDLVCEPGEHVMIIHFLYSNGDEACFILDDRFHQSGIPVPLDIFQKWKEDDGIRPGNIITVKCRKDIKIIVGSSQYGVLTEIDNGLPLDYISITSDLLDKRGEDIFYF